MQLHYMLLLSVDICSITILILFLPSLRDESSYLKTTEKTSRLWTLLIFVKYYYHVIIEGSRRIFWYWPASNSYPVKILQRDVND